MADNVTLNSGSGGAELATDDVGGTQYQRVKINYGGDGSATDVSASNPLPVLGSQTEDAAHGSGDAGFQMLGVRNDTLGALVSADGDYSPLQVNASGALYIQEGSALDASGATITVTGDNSGSLTVDTDGGPLDVSGGTVTTTPNVTGGGTEAAAQRVTIANDSTGVVSVDDNGGSLTVDGTVTANLSSTDNTVLDNIDTNTSGLNNTVGTVGSAAPSQVQVIGAEDASGNVRQPLILNTASDAQADTQLAVLTTTRLFGYNGTTWDRVRLDGSDNLQVNVNAALPAGDNNIGNVDIVSFPDNEPFNVAQVGGNATDTGTGNASTGTQRVVLASDQPAIDASGATVTVDLGANNDVSLNAGSNLVGDVGLSGARTSGGTSFFHSNDLDETEETVKGSAGQIYWLHVMNLSSGVIYLQVFDNTSVTVGTTAPDMEFPVATQGDTNGAGFTLSIPNGIAMGTGIIVAATTDSAGSGAPGANEVFVNIGYA